MADAEQLHRTNARLHQELKTRDDRCRQLQKEKDELSARLESANSTIESLKADFQRLQDILQKVKETKDKEIHDLKQAKRELELRLEQLLAEDIQEEVPLLAKFAATDKTISSVDSTALQLFKPSAQCGASLKELQGELCHWQGMERLSVAIQKIQRETEEDAVVLWTPGSPWGGFPWKYCLRLYLSRTPDQCDQAQSFLQEVYPSLRSHCQDGGCHLVVTTMEYSHVEDLVTESSFSSLVCTEVQLSDVAVLFLGSESTSQVRDELSALQDWESKVKAVVVCVGDSDRVPESYEDDISALTKSFAPGSFLVVPCKEDLSEGPLPGILKDMLKNIFCVPPAPKLSEDMAVDRIVVLQDMRLEQEQEEIARLYTTKRDLIGVKSCFDALQEYLYASAAASVPPFLVRSRPGEGKSSLLVRWLSAIEEDDKVVVLRHFVMTKESLASLPEVMHHRFILQLQHRYAELSSFSAKSLSEDITKEVFSRCLSQVASKCVGMGDMRVLIVIDGADRMQDCFSSLDWLMKPLPLAVKVVLSVDINNHPNEWSAFPCTDIPSLHMNDAEQTVQDVCCSQLEDYHIPFVLEKGPDNPYCRLWSLIAMQYIANAVDSANISEDDDQDEVIDGIIDEFEESKNVSELISYILSSLEEKLGTSGDSLFVMLQFLCHSRYGLTRQELLDLTDVPSTLLSHLFAILSELHILVEVGGIVQFQHPVIQQAVREALYCNTADLGVVKAFMAYYKSADEPPVHISRMLDELTFQLSLTKQSTELQALLSNVEALVFMTYSGSFCYLLKLWRSLKFDLNMMVECYLHWMNGAEGKYADTSHVAQLWQQLGVILRDLEMFPESKRCLEHSLQMYETFFDPDSPQVARNVFELGVMYIKWKKADTAEGLLEQSLAVFEESYGSDSWECLGVLKALKSLKEEQKNPELAVALESEVVQMQNFLEKQGHGSSSIRGVRNLLEKLEGESKEFESVDTAYALHELGVLHAMFGDLDSALSYLGDALSMRMSILSDDHVDTIATLHNMARVASFQGKLAMAQELWEKAFSTLLKVISKEHSGLSDSQDFRHGMICEVMDGLFSVFMEEGFPEKAEALQRFAVELQSSIFGGDDSKLAKALNKQAAALLPLRRLSEAKQCLEQARAIFLRSNDRQSLALVDSNLQLLEQQTEPNQ